MRGFYNNFYLLKEIDRLQQHVLDTISDLEEEQKKSLRLEKDLEATADVQNRVITGVHQIGVGSDLDRSRIRF